MLVGNALCNAFQTVWRTCAAAEDSFPQKEKAKYVTGLDFSPKLFFIREEQEELHKEGSNPNSAAVKDSCK